MMATRKFRCFDCGYEWDVPFGTGQRGIDMACLRCGSHNIHRIDRAVRGMERRGHIGGRAQARMP